MCIEGDEHSLLIGLLIGCTSGGFEIGPGGPNLHLEFSKEASQDEPEMVEEEEEASPTQTVKGERPSLAAWDQNPEAFTHIIGDRVTLELPPNGFEGSIWGLGEYTTDSSIGTAAVHMGLITFQKGGAVTIEITDGRTHYGGLLRNGVVSSRYESWPLSVVFVMSRVVTSPWRQRWSFDRVVHFHPRARTGNR